MKRPPKPLGPELLPSSELATQYREALGSRGFATESDDGSAIALNRNGSMYGLRIEEPLTGFVTLATFLEKERVERYELPLLLTAASAVMSAVPFVRIVPDIEGGDIAFVVDALVSSPDHLARCIDRWVASIDEAGAMFVFAMENVAEKPTHRKNAKSTPADTSVYRLKIRLRNVKPAIWRRIEVTGDVTFAQLHRTLQAAMGWCDAHAHRFEVGRQAIGSADGGALDGARDERRVRLRDVAKVKTKINYWYDFGDDWYHDITVEAIGPPARGQGYPRLLDGARSAPPEDVGGVPGYAAFLEAIGDPAHPEHAEMLEWVGRSFDPERFDRTALERALRKKR